MDEDIAEAAGYGLAALTLAHSLIAQLAVTGLLSPKQADVIIDTAKAAVATYKNQDAAIMASAALDGLKKTWKKQDN